MLDRLPAVLIRIDHHPVTRLRKPLIAGNASGELHEPSELNRIVGIVERRDVALRNHQKVGWRLGIDVAKSECILRVGDDVGRYLAVRYAAEKTFVRHLGQDWG